MAQMIANIQRQQNTDWEHTYFEFYYFYQLYYYLSEC